MTILATQTNISPINLSSKLITYKLLNDEIGKDAGRNARQSPSPRAARPGRLRERGKSVPAAEKYALRSFYNDAIITPFVTGASSLAGYGAPKNTRSFGARRRVRRPARKCSPGGADPRASRAAETRGLESSRRRKPSERDSSGRGVCEGGSRGERARALSLRPGAGRKSGVRREDGRVAPPTETDAALHSRRDTSSRRKENADSAAPIACRGESGTRRLRGCSRGNGAIKPFAENVGGGSDPDAASSPHAANVFSPTHPALPARSKPGVGRKTPTDTG